MFRSPKCLACSLLILLGGCSDGAPPSTLQVQAEIVGGTAGDNAAIVRLGGGGQCTGTLIARNVVLVAKHCVTPFKGGGSFTCNENGKLYVDPDAPIEFVGAGEFDEVRPASTFHIGPNSPYSPRATKVVVSAGDTICASDTALLLLDRTVDDGAIAPLRLDSTVAEGESLTALGYGQHEGGDSSPELLSREVKVLTLGPAPRIVDVADPIAPGFFSTTEGLCRGDSGSPALSRAGAAVGVGSSVGRPDLHAPTGTADDCIGSRAKYEATASQAKLIEETLASVGALPWREGESDPEADRAAFGEACVSDDSCRSGACVVHDDGEARCSQGCLDSECPDEHECRELDNRKRCVWSEPASAPEAEDDASEDCGIAAAPRGALRLWPLLLAAALASVRRSSHARA